VIDFTAFSLSAQHSNLSTICPALVVDVTDEDAFIMSLAENIARRGYRPLEFLADIEVLPNLPTERSYSAEIIIQKTGLSPKYVKDIVFLLDQGEERLIEGVQRGTIPLTTALEIARANENATEGDGQTNLGGKTSVGDSGLRTESKARKTWLRWFFYSAPSAQSSALIVTHVQLQPGADMRVARTEDSGLSDSNQPATLLSPQHSVPSPFVVKHFVNLLRAGEC